MLFNETATSDTISMKVGQFMYVKNTNKTAIQSRHMIADALFQLMKRKLFSKITITEICEEAAIGRKTFYRNFEFKEDVIEFQLDRMVKEYEKEIEGLSFKELLRHHFEFVRRYVDVFTTLYQNDLLWITAKKFNTLLPKTLPIWDNDPLEQEYRSGYMMAGIEAIQRIWIERGCHESIDEIMEIIQRAQEKCQPLGN